MRRISTTMLVFLLHTCALNHSLHVYIHKLKGMHKLSQFWLYAEGRKHPIGYVSRKLLLWECNYATVCYCIALVTQD